MRVVIQRVLSAKVEVENHIVGEVKQGFLLLVGIHHEDNETIVAKMANKVINMRIFSDEAGKMNQSILAVGGEILSVSQFTLYADCKRGNRPGFSDAARQEQATFLYDKFNELLQSSVSKVATGVFGADMQVSLVNDGPVTILLDSKEL